MSQIDHRRELCARQCTLDGEPALIRGACEPFAKIRRRDGRGGDVEFAWPTIERVLEAGGHFQS